MPKATAVWLVDNTSLTFDQIAHFCSLHHLEVKAIADGDLGQGIKGLNPLLTGQLTQEQIDEAQLDSSVRLEISSTSAAEIQEERKNDPSKKAKRYTPVSVRQNRPSAILWLVRNHPELKDAQIIRLVRTTKGTISSIRDRTHWNISQLQPLDPVSLGICTQSELDKEVSKIVSSSPPPSSDSPDDSLLPASETQDGLSESSDSPTATADEVFKNFSDSPSQE